MSTDAIKSVRRVFEILEHFDEVKRPLSLQEVVARFGYPTSSTAAMLKSMMLIGYLNYDISLRTYLPTTRLAALGVWAGEAFLHQDILLAAIDRLKTRIGETVAIAAQSDIYVQYLHVSYSTEPLQYRVTPGTLRPITGAGLGWMLLSRQEDDAIEVMWRRCNRARGSRIAVIPLGTLHKEVKHAREKQYTVSRHTVTQGAGAVSMLLPEHFFGRTLALSVGAPVWRMDENLDLILREMRATIAQFPRSSSAKRNSK